MAAARPSDEQQATAHSAAQDLLPQHATLIRASGIAPDVAAARGYRSVITKVDLKRAGFADSQCIVPTLLIPVHDARGELALYQHRPDDPRIKDGRTLKYETPARARMVLDVPPASRPQLGNPATPLFITEGVRKGDSLVSLGLCAIALLGVWNWRGTNEMGGKMALPDWENIALNDRRVYVVFDSDVMVKPEVHAALQRLAAFLKSRGAHALFIYLPHSADGKCGVDDFLADDHGVDDLLALATTTLRQLQHEQPREDGLPGIVGAGRLTDITEAAIRTLAKSNTKEPRIFQQGGAIARLRFDDGTPRVEALGFDALRGELDRAAVWVSAKGDLSFPPMAVVRNILALPGYDLPPLRAVAEAPYFDGAGRLIAADGYDAESRVFLRLPTGLTVPLVPPAPSDADVLQARALIEELLHDFRFADHASKAHAVGLLVAPFVRDLIDGLVPLHASDAPMPGSGKGKLVNAVSLIVTGRPIEVMSEAKDSDEMRKRVTALLLAGGPLGLFDNVTHRLESGVFAALLTAETWRDRILGASRMVNVANRTIWVATGNNLEFSRENARRAVWIRIDAKTAEPHLRSNFLHDPLEPWVLQRRGDLVWAVLVLVRNWIARGRRPFTSRRLGSYEAWAKTVGGILDVAGIFGFLGNLEAFSGKADEETSSWKLFAAAWWDEHHDAHVTMDELFKLAETMLPDVLGGGQEKSQRIKLGKALGKRICWRFSIKLTETEQPLEVEINRAVVRDTKGHERHRWSLVACAPETPLNLRDKGEGTGNSVNGKPLGFPPSSRPDDALGGDNGAGKLFTLSSGSAAPPLVPLVKAETPALDAAMAAHDNGGDDEVVV
jgi:hypothetical protein